MKKNTHALCTLILILGTFGCGGFARYHLVSDEYGFSVEFPDKPNQQVGTNYQGLSRSLWTLQKDASREFFSAEATNYREPLNAAPNWIPNGENLASVGIQTVERTHFKLRAASTGREVLAIATTARQALSGDIIRSIYVVDGSTLISVTARTADEQRRDAFLKSLTLLR